MKINEIFYSLQGEGYFSGVPAVFVRFSGCNLKCPFCDTLHEEGKEMSVEEIVSVVCQYPALHVVLTGGEPSLFIDSHLIKALHDKQRFVAIETNGTRLVEEKVDWITLSPKLGQAQNAQIQQNKCDELKLVYQNDEQIKRLIKTLEESNFSFAKHLFLQPCDTGISAKNQKIIEDCVSFCKSNPLWRLSLQMHKLINIK